MYSINELPRSARWILQPWRMAVLILAITFIIEGLLMIVLPAIVGELEQWKLAAIDACLLTVLLAPCVWRLMVRPLQRIAETRRQLLTWAMSMEERKVGEISRDLHDNFGQLLTSITIGLRTIEEISNEPAVVNHAKRIRQTGLDLHHSIRSLARGLRPTVLDDLGLAAALANLASDWSDASDAEITLHVDGLQDYRLPSEVETAIYRIAQEAITNAVRHANCQRVRIQSSFDGQTLELAISDDGVGFRVDKMNIGQKDRRPFGLISMRERAESIGASFRIRSSIGHGTRIEVKVRFAKSQIRRSASFSSTEGTKDFDI